MMLFFLLSFMMNAVAGGKVRKITSQDAAQVDASGTSPGAIMMTSDQVQTVPVTCGPSSPECCWVVRLWQQWGKTTSVDPQDSSSCCESKSSGIQGVLCKSDKVFWIDWKNQSLTGPIPDEIDNLRNLKYLTLSYNQLNGSIPSTIGNLLELNRLQLDNNQLSSPIPEEIGNLKNLLHVSLGNNQLNGSIPPEIGNLTKLLFLSLNSNQLSGSIPVEIGNLKNLGRLYLFSNKLNGSIPKEIGMLKDLENLSVSKNQLSGPIPVEIEALAYLLNLGINRNSGLSGFLTPQCSTRVYAEFTGVTICGCASENSPAYVMPPFETPKECLAASTVSSIEKRTFIFSHEIESYKFTCHSDSDNSAGNPFQDCFNMMAVICHPVYLGTDKSRIDFCKKSVDSMTKGLNYWWQNVRKSCGKWPWEDGTIGDPNSYKCEVANLALKKNTYYITEEGKMQIPSSLTDSINRGLWKTVA